MNYDFKYIPNPKYDANNKNLKSNFPEIIDPLCEASKLFCQIELKIIEIHFLEDFDLRKVYLDVFDSYLNEIRSYINYADKSNVQHYLNELAAYENNIKVFFPSKIRYGNLLNKIFNSVEGINYKILREEYSHLKFHKITSTPEKKRLFNKALRLIAHHQVAPPAWLANLILENILDLPPKKIKGLKIEKFEELISEIKAREKTSLSDFAASKNIERRYLDKIIEKGKLLAQEDLLRIYLLP
ncbi:MULTISPECIES: hypothetical protein [Methylotenera]|uniref:hypothetical protein n=1 Tax=Methylotenera TaxID=359407 RepID=UPI00037FE0F5|nr:MULTISPECIES: hypothetical protein [Methylotenera]